MLDCNFKDNFFVINSDIVVGGRQGEDTYPLKEMLLFHNLHGKKATLLTTYVDDPCKYGEIISDQNTGKVTQIAEKPVEVISNQVNSGIYLLSTDIFADIGLNQDNIVNDLFYKY